MSSEASRLTDDERETLKQALAATCGDPDLAYEYVAPAVESIKAAAYRAGQADAWTEGYGVGTSDCSRYLGAVEANRYPRPTDTNNPYRGGTA